MSVFLHRIGLLKPIPAEEYSCNMTAGDAFGSQGYNIDVPMIGSIDAEPITGEVLESLVSGNVNQVSFTGDLTSLLSGLTLWVDSVEYPFDTDWAYDGGNDRTIGLWSSSSTAPEFVDTNTYFVEIK